MCEAVRLRACDWILVNRFIPGVINFLSFGHSQSPEISNLTKNSESGFRSTPDSKIPNCTMATFEIRKVPIDTTTSTWPN